VEEMITIYRNGRRRIFNDRDGLVLYSRLCAEKWFTQKQWYTQTFGPSRWAKRQAARKQIIENRNEMLVNKYRSWIEAEIYREELIDSFMEAFACDFDRANMMANKTIKERSK
jgi:hypothetical protein